MIRPCLLLYLAGEHRELPNFLSCLMFHLELCDSWYECREGSVVTSVSWLGTLRIMDSRGHCYYFTTLLWLILIMLRQKRRYTYNLRLTISLILFVFFLQLLFLLFLFPFPFYTALLVSFPLSSTLLLCRPLGAPASHSPPHCSSTLYPVALPSPNPVNVLVGLILARDTPQPW